MRVGPVHSVRGALTNRCRMIRKCLQIETVYAIGSSEGKRKNGTKCMCFATVATVATAATANATDRDTVFVDCDRVETVQHSFAGTQINSSLSIGLVMIDDLPPRSRFPFDSQSNRTAAVLTAC